MYMINGKELREQMVSRTMLRKNTETVLPLFESAKNGLEAAGWKICNESVKADSASATAVFCWDVYDSHYELTFELKVMRIGDIRTNRVFENDSRVSNEQVRDLVTTLLSMGFSARIVCFTKDGEPRASYLQILLDEGDATIGIEAFLQCDLH